MLDFCNNFNPQGFDIYFVHKRHSNHEEIAQIFVAFSEKLKFELVHVVLYVTLG